jgi:hypothetical protein
MSLTIDIDALQGAVVADVPWHGQAKPRGTLRLVSDALVVEQPDSRARIVEIPLAAIVRSSVDMSFGVLPALRVWHTMDGREVWSRFEFSAADEESGEGSGPSIAEHLGPGVARDAARRVEGGFRVLSGGLNLGKRTARQAVEGMARQEEYRIWVEAITQARARAQQRAEASPQAKQAAERGPIVSPDAQLPSGDAASLLAWFREEVVVRGIPVIQPLYPLDSPTCRIVVLGEFSRGKSTVINALFGINGEIALPTGMTPTTPLACAVRVPSVGESDGATISYRTGREPLSLTLDEFRQGVRVVEEGDVPVVDTTGRDMHLHEATRVEVRITGAYLPSGVEIEDTPGLNEQAGRSRSAHAALGRADLVLFVLAADQLLGDHERNVVDRELVGGFHRNVLFFVNFWDSVTDESQRGILRRRATTILRDFPSPFRGMPAAGAGEVGGEPDGLQDLFFVSALQAARAQRQRKPAPDESGIPQLRARLRRLLGPESAELLLRARTGRALRFVQLLRQAVSKSLAAGAASSAPDASRTRSGSAAKDEAIESAVRVARTMPGAVAGATARLITSLDMGTSNDMTQLSHLLDTTMDEATTELRRSVSARLRSIAAEYAATAQDGVDLVLAQARAEFLRRGRTPPPLDQRFEALAFVLPAEAGVAAFRALVQAVPALLRQDLDDKGKRLEAGLMAAIRGQGQAGTADAATPRETAHDAGDRTVALRELEDDLLRVEKLIRRAFDRT